MLDGTPYRDAAREAGLASHQDLHRAAKKPGLLEIHSSQLVGGFRRLVDLTNEELERRLVEHPDEISTKDLAVVGGIATDKVAKFEGWGRDQGSSSVASQVADRLGALGGTLAYALILSEVLFLQLLRGFIADGSEPQER